MIGRSPIERLRHAVEALPEDARIAMLTGIREREIIAGAYADRVGGMCPMLAARRCGTRASTTAFARAWDGFTRAKTPRTATPRELWILEGLLEASLLETVVPDYELSRV